MNEQGMGDAVGNSNVLEVDSCNSVSLVMIVEFCTESSYHGVSYPKGV